MESVLLKQIMKSLTNYWDEPVGSMLSVVESLLSIHNQVSL